MRRGGLGYNENACRPGCRLPCCVPRRRCPPNPSCFRNPCVFIPTPARSTTRYCGDPCSPPAPRCTPRPCPPCKPMCPPPRPRPRCSPCVPRRPLRRPCKPFSCAPKCPPRRCRDPCSPCKPRARSLCCPRRPPLCDPICDPCPVRPYRRKCRRRPRPRCSSSSSYCESPCSPRRFYSSGRYSSLDRCCLPPCDEPCGDEPHQCPWEADVTVTGTVRGHCTSTAVEVAKRLTGKFVSRGRRYTCKNGKSDYRICSSQTMTLGHLDDGSRLDFCRSNEDEDVEEEGNNEEDTGQEESKDIEESKTNNATQNSSASTNSRSWRISGSGRDLELRSKRSSGKEEVTFATAVIGGEQRDQQYNYENNDYNDVPYRRQGRDVDDYYHRTEIPKATTSRQNRSRHHHGRGLDRGASLSPDSDVSSYQTASEDGHYGKNNVTFSRLPTYSNRDSSYPNRREPSEKHRDRQRDRAEERSRKVQDWQRKARTEEFVDDDEKDFYGQEEPGEAYRSEGKGDRMYEYEDDDADDIDDIYHYPSPSHDKSEGSSPSRQKRSGARVRESSRRPRHRRHRLKEQSMSRDSPPREGSFRRSGDGRHRDGRMTNEVCIEPLYPDSRRSSDLDYEDDRSSLWETEREPDPPKQHRRRTKTLKIRS